MYPIIGLRAEIQTFRITGHFMWLNIYLQLQAFLNYVQLICTTFEQNKTLLAKVQPEYRTNNLLSPQQLTLPLC